MRVLSKESCMSKLKERAADFVHIPEDEWDALYQACFVRTYKKKDYFVKADERPSGIGFIISGVFRVYYTSEDGVEKTMVFRSSGQFISAYSSFLTNQKSLYSIQAIADSVVLYIPIETFRALEFGHDCWKVFIGKYTQYLFVEKEERERTLLLMSALERYNQFLLDYGDVLDYIPNYMIASYLGITPESLSRILRD